MTTAAGPQLLSDCQMCFISGKTAIAGASFGVGSDSAGAGADSGAATVTGATTSVAVAGAPMAGAGIAGLLIFGMSDRKDERAMLASERDHVVTRAIHAVKDAAPDLAVATDVCVCAYTTHGQCVLFTEGNADVAGTLARLAEIAVVHADAGADLLMPSGMLDGSVAAPPTALPSVRPESVAGAAMAN